VNHQSVGFRHVGRHKVDARLLKAGQEVNVAGEAIEFGDEQNGARSLGDFINPYYEPVLSRPTLQDIGTVRIMLKNYQRGR
jgi:hypothetical protein